MFIALSWLSTYRPYGTEEHYSKSKFLKLTLMVRFPNRTGYDYGITEIFY